LNEHLKIIVEIYQDLAASYPQKDEVTTMDEPSFSVHDFYEDLRNSNLIINEQLSYRFVSALISKPFVILTGLSGSGKTKIAQAFCKWLDPAEDNSRFILTPVGSDWTNREPLLGYPNALEPGSYIKPDNGVLDLLIEAGKRENRNKPYFLILDEMNLSHVERYFADFLSAIESSEPIPIHPEEGEWADSEIPAEIFLPDNLFFIGTVNIDETTYMFSPKVLDRAQVIEFHVTAEDIQQFLENPQKPDLSILLGNGENSASDFLRLAQSTWNLIQEDKEEVQTVLENFFQELQKTGAEFGYRTAFEISRFCAIFSHLTEHGRDFWKIERIIDAAVIQKLLPRLHGSRKKLEPVLNSLAQLCFIEGTEEYQNLLEAFSEAPDSIAGAPEVRYPISLEKILRMQKRVAQEGFTSFAEA
jgi:5-methylcytosine-specific restriction protein B